jgi:hypothetical protein
MTNARQLLEAKIAEQTTEMLLTAVRTLNTDTSIEAITAAAAIEHELSKRMTEAEFIALMDELEAEIMAA